MSDVSKTECAICFEMIRYGQEVETIEMLYGDGHKDTAFAHMQCAVDELDSYDDDRICSWPCEHCGEEDPDDWEDV